MFTHMKNNYVHHLISENLFRVYTQCYDHSLLTYILHKPTNSSEGHAYQTTAVTATKFYVVLNTLSCVRRLMGFVRKLH